MVKKVNTSEILSTPWLLVDLTVLYVVWSVIGVGLESFYSLITQGHWETHVVSMIGPFCVIYGFGAALYYVASALIYNKHFIVRFLIFGSIGTFFELLCGLLLLYGLNMMAWDYRTCFLNYKGVICLEMFGIWGLLGMGFCAALPKTHALLSKLHRQPFGIIAGVVAAIMILDLIFTGICIVRWKKRFIDHAPPASALDRVIDERYPDDYMQHRFVEWFFLDAPETETASLQ